MNHWDQFLPTQRGYVNPHRRITSTQRRRRWRQETRFVLNLGAIWHAIMSGGHGKWR